MLVVVDQSIAPDVELILHRVVYDDGLLILTVFAAGSHGDVPLCWVAVPRQ